MADQTFDFQQTGQTLQERLNQVPINAQTIAALQEAITAFVNTEQVQTLITTALQPYSTTEEMNTAINSAITSALASYYTKTATDNLLAGKVDKVSGKQLSTEDFTTELKTKLKALPTATDLSAQISSAISTALSSYSTTAEMNTAIGNAIATALTSYYTKTEVDAIVLSNTNDILFLNRALGKYNSIAERTLSQAVAGKYVNVNGQEVSASGYGISETLDINAGGILLNADAEIVRKEKQERRLTIAAGILLVVLGLFAMWMYMAMSVSGQDFYFGAFGPIFAILVSAAGVVLTLYGLRKKAG